MQRTLVRYGALPFVLALASSGLAAQAPESPLDSAQRRASVSAAASVADLTRGSLADRLSAVRAAPFTAEPEASLPALVELAAGRDPSLSPAAAVAVHRIAETLSKADLDAHEADVAAVDAARTRLVALARDASARADVRRLATLAAAELAALTAR